MQTPGINGVIVGDYRVSVASGLTTGMAANDTVFAFRWASTTHRCAIRALRLHAQIITPFTAANEVDVHAIIARTYTASDTGGTALTLTGNNNSLHSYSNVASKVTDSRVATTATLTAGTRTLDSQAFLRAVSMQSLAAAAAAQAAVVAQYHPYHDRHPLILTTNEGIIVRSGIAQGAGGTVRFTIDLEWSESLNETS